MNRTEYLLGKLAEECVEVAQRCSKANCFGVEEIYAGNGRGLTNAQLVMDELEDVRVIVELLREQGVLSLDPINPERFAAKRAKVLRYMSYSEERGCLVQRHHPSCDSVERGPDNIKKPCNCEPA